MKRRTFLTGSTAALALASPARAKGQLTLKAGVIGHTGRGNFGHGLDTVWNLLPEAEIVGVSDPDVAGLEKALKKLKCPTETGFADYRKMLEQTKPDFVTVCPRHPDQHLHMTLAAIAAGVRGIYIEKPFCRTPAEADQIVEAAKKANAKIAVAHRNRYEPALAVINSAISAGRIGKVLEIRGRGKGDKRGGGEDLWVLGTHVLNLIHYFGGAPVDCSAVILQDGKAITGDDVAEGNEALGLLAGNELHARYRLDSGLLATFDSIANDGSGGNGFGLQIIGSDGIINIRCDRDPVAHLIPGNPFEPTSESRPWIPVTAAGIDKPESEAQRKQVAEVHNHVAPIRDLIAAVNEDRAPLCDAQSARLTVEMVTAVFESHRMGGKAVAFPLQERNNPLAKL